MKKIGINKLLRKPFSEFEDQYYPDEVKFIDSPNKKFYVATSHFDEIRMMFTIHLFTLLNDKNEVITNFEPLVALGYGNIKWSSDSKYFSIPISSEYDSYLIFNVENLKFSAIKIKNYWKSKIEMYDSKILIKNEKTSKNILFQELEWKNLADLENYSNLLEKLDLII